MTPGRIPQSAEACRATQFSDQMSCRYCGRVCDVNELSPPTCPLTQQPMRASGGPAKRCFMYCGDDRCDCGAAEELQGLLGKILL